MKGTVVLSRRRFLSAMFTLIVSFSLCAIIAEVSLRLIVGSPEIPGVDRSFPRELVIRNPLTKFQLKPHSRAIHKRSEFTVLIEANARGLRDRDFGPKRSGVTRIISLGDSFAFGWGVPLPNSYSKILERELNGRLPREVEVVNASLPARGTPEEIAQLEALADLQPDLVLLLFTIENDIVEFGSDSSRQPRYALQVPFPFKDWLIRNSTLALCASEAYHRILVRLGLRPRNLSRPFMELYLSPYLSSPPKAEQVYGSVRSNFQRLRDVVQALQATVAVVLIPAREQLFPYTEWRSYADAYGFTFESLVEARDHPNRYLTSISEKLGLPVLDLMRTEPQPDRSYYFREDIHWNKTGHAWAAQATAEFLVKNKLVHF
jgi:hypothetical protein